MSYLYSSDQMNRSYDSELKNAINRAKELIKESASKYYQASDVLIILQLGIAVKQLEELYEK